MAAQEKGVRLVLASGRPSAGVKPLARELEMDKYGGFILSYNGAQVIDLKNNKTVYEKTLDPDVIRSSKSSPIITASAF